MDKKKSDVPFSQSILNSNEDQVDCIESKKPIELNLTASQAEEREREFWKSKKEKEEYRVVDFMYGMLPRPIKIQTTD